MPIVDNVDDTEVLEGSEGLLDYLPKSDSGLTVFTTRDKTTAQALAGNCILEVEELDLAMASALFKKMLTRKHILYEKAVIDELLPRAQLPSLGDHTGRCLRQLQRNIR